MILALLLACSAEDVPLAPAPGVWVEARRVDEGAPVVLHLPSGATPPAVEGLTATQVATSDDGATRWELRGKSGSYVVPVPGAEGAPVNLYVDIGVKGPTGGPMEDLAALPPSQPPMWPWVVGGVALTAALTALGMWAWRRFRPVPPPPPPEPADVVARREWAALRGRTDLGEAELALELSAVYRRYLEAAHRWPATRRTTREILDNLAGELTSADLVCSRRLLGAMDLVKFAERGEVGGVFDQLDADFAQVVRPVGGPRA